MNNQPLKFTKGSKVGLIACSDGLKEEALPKINELIQTLNHFGLEVIVARTLMRRASYFSGTPAERAEELNRLFKNDEISAIFDISGGDSANQILDYLDYDCIRINPKPFFGISDLSVILNGLYTRSDSISFHFRLMNLVYSDGEVQRKWFYRTFFEGQHDLFDFKYKWVRGNHMSGIVIGGNIRCFLKLSGTNYLPDPEGKILFLESLSGRASRIVSLTTQLHQIGYLDRCAGLILGSFTELENYNEYSIVEEYIKEITQRTGIPIIKTDELGHGSHSKCIMIGQNIVL
ncbi:S66 peptidase family protein [Paenibacillus faecalis]|uniref:S66 peptidase family protein n=1 Tax=Paenibacillus faecalis TaxID=2079532 RepID=UPI000D0F79D6|nr:S66 peptidase family protein [Paenibacillus faecalis]